MKQQVDLQMQVQSDLELKHQQLLLGIDSLFAVHVALFIFDILWTCQVHPAVDSTVYLYKTHPIRNVRISGIIMSVHQSSKYIRYSVDDGTGSISCIEWNNSHTSTNDTQHLGDLVCIMGRLSTFEDERHITIHSIAHQTNPNYETTEWLTVMSLKQDVYDKPLVVPKSIKQAVISKYGTDAAQDSTVKQVTNENKQFVDALQDHIGALPDSAIVHFSKTSQDAQLRLAAIQSLKNKTTDANKQTQLVARQFSYGFKRMVEQGILALRDEESDTYEKITHQGNLGIEILEIIRQESRQAKSRMKGVSQDFVVLRLQEQQRFQRVPKLRIIESIQQLNSTADIYSVDATHYAAV